MFIKRLRRELSIFNQLQPDARKLMLSIFCMVIANNLIFVFANAYLFVSTNNISSVAVFNLGTYIALLFGFYLNTYLTKFIKIHHIFVPSLVLQSGSLVVLFFFKSLSLWSILGVGLLSGLWSGLYWANRNFVYPALTKNKERDYIAGLNTLVSNLSGVVLPVVAGWLIVWTRNHPQLKDTHGYLAVMIFGVLLLFIGTIFLGSIKEFPAPKITSFWPKKISQDWKFFRIFILASSMQMAVGATVMEIITLLFVGDEGVLGTLKSALAVVVGLMIYAVGRKMKPKDRFKLLAFGMLPLVLSILLLLVVFNQITIIIYLAAMILSSNIFWFVYIPVMSQATWMQNNGRLEDNYAYILDHEFFINLGRVTSMLFILFAFNYWDQKTSLMVVVVMGAVLRALGLFAAKKLIALQNP